ncbi:MAG: hypothetical protein ABR572_12080 [Cryomorphaceae bacterium]|nr:hypothetical protein [Flavobacteriales bacterium]
MSDLDFRPRFRIRTSLSVEGAEKLILEKLRRHNPDDFRSAIVKGHVVLSISPEKKHFWSPQMDISIAATEKGDEEYPGTLVRCLTAPAPAVWTMFMFFYGFAGFTVLAGLMIASSQYTLDYDLWGLWIAGGGALLGIALFAVAQTGKGLAKDEMRAMKRFVDGVFERTKQNGVQTESPPFRDKVSG